MISTNEAGLLALSLLAAVSPALGATAMLGQVGSSCPNDCSQQGYCHTSGSCVCYPGWTGDDCGVPAQCPRQCNLQGVCTNSTCACYPGFGGDDCSLRLCPKDCSGQGSCHKGKCVCAAGFTGVACEHLRCPNDCTSAERHTLCDGKGCG